MTMTTTTAYETAEAVPAAPLSRRAEQREDTRLRAQLELDREQARAELELAREAARAEQRRADDREWAQERRQARADKDARKAAARAERAKAGQARRKWLHEHMVDLLFVPVIGVPGALAWDAMAAYGSATWGPLGAALPLFSEGAMWAFDAAVAIRRRRDPGKPVWHLQLGIVIFAAYGAALNFLHGMAPATAHHGLVVAVSMALVSVAGVTAHQLVIAGPRRSRAERELDMFRREAERRQAAARKAAARMALVDVDEHGHADLVYEPGTYRLTRTRRLAAPKGRPAGRAGLPPQQFYGPQADRELAARPFQPPAEPAPAGYQEAARYPAGPAGHPAAVAGQPATAEPGVREAPAGRAGFPPPQFYGPGAGGGDSGGSDEDAGEWVGWPQVAVAEQLATQIRAAAAAGATWKPDYEQLIALTDKSLRWCQKAVSVARDLAKDPAPDDGETSQSSRGRAGNVPGAARTTATQPAGAAAENT